MKVFHLAVFAGVLLIAQNAAGHGPLPMPLQKVPIPPVPGLLDGPSPIVVDKNAAIALGKALFWDVSVGSDGMACGSCHFHAGADRRVKNQLDPGLKSNQPSGQTFQALPTGGGGPNYTLRLGDFPTYQFSDPLNNASTVTFKTDDVVSSSGTFSGGFTGASQFSGKNDDCNRSVDPIFHIGAVGTRRVEPRNTPTVINAIFNYRNFWDGRANNIFNGSSPWGDRDANAGVWVKVNARTASKQRLRLENSALASLAVGPPLNDVEMSCQQRVWPNIGRKLLLRQPLQTQKVHNEDSVLGVYSYSTAGNLKPGLKTTYKQLVSKAFNQKYWAYTGIGPFGGPPGQVAYNQMEANFSMFFGLALQLYQATLVSDQAPIDLTPRNAAHVPTWEGMGYSPEKIATLQQGFAAFEGNHCNLCHAGPLLTTVAISTNSTLVTPTPDKFFGPDHYLIPYGPNAFGVNNQAGSSESAITRNIKVVARDDTTGGPKLVDFGFANTGVNDPNADPGVGGVDDFGNPLSFVDQYVQYLLGNNAGVKDSVVFATRSCDFFVPLASNTTRVFDSYFTIPDGIEIDGSREGVLKDQNCAKPANKYIPTIAAANTSLTAAPKKLAVATGAVFKIPNLRNIELTGPFMHNGSLATLEQVVEFYARLGNVNNPNKNSFMNSISLTDPTQRAQLVEFLKTLTDERVRYGRAPFDHPEIAVPNGHPGNQTATTAGNPLNPNLARDTLLVIPAVGANGSATPILPFEAYLAP